MKKLTINYFLHNTELYAIQKQDLKKCARLMASAFTADPSIRYLLDGECEGQNDWQYFYTVMKSVFGKCVMLSNDRELHDLLILFPPELKAVPTFSFFINGGMKLPAFFKKGLLIRSLKYETNCKRMKEQVVSKNTWYCMCLVVSPELQGQGRASRLMRSVFKRFDENNTSLYLETHKSTNVEIYKHFGFCVKSSAYIPKTENIQYGMLR